jgi:hypothetical protein
LIGFFHQINALSSCCYLSKSFVAEKKHGLCKVIHKEKEKKKERIGKNRQVFEIFKTMGTQMSA